jgi:ABC-type transport system substrate-binding protein
MVDRTVVSSDGMKYTFWLRDGLRWYDGQPVLSEDCVESLKRREEAIVEHSQIKAIQLLKESGYDGTPIVVLQITDRPFLDAAAVVTRQRLESVGFRVILKAMDWSTNLVVRARKTAPDKGGWNLLFTWFHGAVVIDPAVHFCLSGAGPNALVRMA